MSIDMPTGGFSWLPMEDKDIHSGGFSTPHTPIDGFQFFIDKI
jgi:hypothetical protein